jgi:cytochrome c oxidase subunit II
MHPLEAERAERFFITIAGVCLVVFLIVLAYTSVHMGIHLPGPAGRIIPRPGEPLARAVLRTPPFNHVGVHQTGPHSYEADFLAQAWMFMPSDIEVPAGADVTFVATSIDVTHGFFIAGTRVNMMLIPGYISKTSYTFREPGKYLLLCHEYCGILHHTMQGTVTVR